MNKKIIAGILIGVVVLVGAGLLLSGKQTEADATEQSANVVLEETSYDWGKIGIDNGNVEKEFVIKNEGGETLKLSNVITSCMCTSAQFSDGESPIFGMHGKSDYVKTVEPGEETRMKVVFDPAFHGPTGVGPINRQVKITTNDPEKPLITLMLTAVVVRN